MDPDPLTGLPCLASVGEHALSPTEKWGVWEGRGVENFLLKCKMKERERERERENRVVSRIWKNFGKGTKYVLHVFFFPMETNKTAFYCVAETHPEFMALLSLSSKW